MALQPASGARDLLPRDVGVNRWIAEQLSAVYRRWGYEEVTPPSLERIDTLEAGGAIQSHQVVQVVADEALGLRPEMTASIARAACTRLAAMQRPCACTTAAPPSSPTGGRPRSAHRRRPAERRGTDGRPRAGR